MTREYRMRLAAGGGPPPKAATFATVRVRLPEGLLLQGEFNAGEPVWLRRVFLFILTGPFKLLNARMRVDAAARPSAFCQATIAIVPVTESQVIVRSACVGLSSNPRF